jgi:hypothetical protein
MANNRDEFQSAVDTNIAAVVDIADHKLVLKDNLSEDIVFRKDVISSTVTAAAGSLTVDFENDGVDTKQFDLILANSNSANVSITINNTVNGDDQKYIALTKGATDTVSFVNATDVSIGKNYIDTVAIYVVYRVTNKENLLYVEAINIDKDINETTTKVVQLGDWDMDANSSLSVAHGITNFQDIIRVSVMIYTDAPVTLEYPLDAVDSSISQFGGVGYINATNVILYRLTGGFFDSTSFDATSYNRGYMIIEYKN